MNNPVFEYTYEARTRERKKKDITLFTKAAAGCYPKPQS
jgi:hypothetical protein